MLEKNEYLTTIDNNIVKNILTKFLDYESNLFNKVVSKWKEYKRVNHDEYFSELKPYIVKLYNNIISDDEYQNIEEKAVDYLSIGETMINTYKDNTLPDYSSIAINYYKALEYLINQFIYVPYRKIVLENIENPSINNCSGYCGDSYKKIFKNESPRVTLEFGTIAIFYKNISNDKYERVREFYNEHINFDKMIVFFEKMYNIKEKRNEAAHGGTIINLHDAHKARSYIYTKEEEARDIYELVFEIKKIFI